MEGAESAARELSARRCTGFSACELVLLEDNRESPMLASCYWDASGVQGTLSATRCRGWLAPPVLHVRTADAAAQWGLYSAKHPLLHCCCIMTTRTRIQCVGRACLP